jgi:hypothetical protein
MIAIALTPSVLTGVISIAVPSEQRSRKCPCFPSLQGAPPVVVQPT